MTQLGSYLGTPIFTTCRQTSAYQYLVDKIHKKIEGWQAKYLSVMGRVTLINSTTISLYPYPCHANHPSPTKNYSATG